MGYTHYWKLLSVPTIIAVRKVLSEVPLILNLSQLECGKIKLTGKDYEDINSKPVFSQDEIYLNGFKGDAHQDFYIDFKKVTEFNFCKTNRKPYDFIVSLILISCNNHIKGFSSSSDEDREHWSPIVNLYEKNISKIQFDLKKLYGEKESEDL